MGPWARRVKSSNLGTLIERVFRGAGLVSELVSPVRQTLRVRIPKPSHGAPSPCPPAGRRAQGHTSKLTTFGRGGVEAQGQPERGKLRNSHVFGGSGVSVARRREGDSTAAGVKFSPRYYSAHRPRIVHTGELRSRKRKSLTPGCTGSFKAFAPCFPVRGGGAVGSSPVLQQAAAFPASGGDLEFSPRVRYLFLLINVKY